MKRAIAFLLLLAMTAAAASCGGAAANVPASDGTTAANNGDAEVTTAAEPTAADLYAAAKASIAEKDYNGKDFVIGARNSGAFITVDIVAEVQNGDPINDAVYERNTFLSERLNVNVKQLAPDNQPAAAAYKTVMAGDQVYDAVTDGLSLLAKNIIQNGAAVDLNTLPDLDLSADCWDQELIEGLSIKNKVYLATGDVSIMDNYGTWCVLFNKGILHDYTLDDPYELVNKGSWTFQKMYEMIKTAAHDLDGDGVMGDWDQYGLLSEDFNTFGFWSASGEKIITKDKDDMPVLSLYNQRSASVLETVMEIQQDAAHVMGSDRHKKTNVPAGIDPVDMMFKGGYSLFIFGGLWLVSDYRDSEVDFGILPAPKYNEAQDKYYNTYSYCNCTAYIIPITMTDAEMTGEVMQAMALISKYTLTPAYYDIALEGKFLRDEESAGMIELVLSTRNYDLGSIFDWGGCYSIFSQLYRANSFDLASKYNANEEKILAAIDQFCDLDFMK